MRCAPRRDACNGPSRPTGRCARRSWRCPLGRARAAVRRSDRLVLFARSGNRHAALEEEDRGARRGAADRRARRLQRQRFRSGRVLGRNAVARSGYPCCTFRGSVVALRIRDGQQVWKSYLVPEPKPTGKTKRGTPQFGPSGAGVWASPTLDAKRGVMYVATGDNYSSPATP